LSGKNNRFIYFVKSRDKKKMKRYEEKKSIAYISSFVEDKEAQE